MEQKLQHQGISEQDRHDMLRRLDEINTRAIDAGVPISEEAAYFRFLNAVLLLKIKILNIPIKLKE